MLKTTTDGVFFVGFTPVNGRKPVFKKLLVY
jgi:hypothetical protein